MRTLYRIQLVVQWPPTSFESFVDKNLRRARWSAPPPRWCRDGRYDHFPDPMGEEALPYVVLPSLGFYSVA